MFEFSKNKTNFLNPLQSENLEWAANEGANLELSKEVVFPLKHYEKG